MKKIQSLLFVFCVMCILSNCEIDGGSGGSGSFGCGGGESSEENCSVHFLEGEDKSCDELCEEKGYDYAKSGGTDVEGKNGMYMTAFVVNKPDSSNPNSTEKTCQCTEDYLEVSSGFTLDYTFCKAVICGNGKLCYDESGYIGYGICGVPATKINAIPWTYCRCCK